LYKTFFFEKCAQYIVWIRNRNFHEVEPEPEPEPQ
jgi:hypothetical protein